MRNWCMNEIIVYINPKDYEGHLFLNVSCVEKSAV